MEPEHAEPYRVFELDGVTVAIIGTATPEPPGRTFPWQERDDLLEFQPIEESVRDVVAMLEERADIIVLLTHQYMNDDTKLAPALPGVDIIFGGHDHARFHDVFVVRGTDTIIQRSGAYGDTFGELTVLWDGERIVHPEWRVVAVTDELPVSVVLEEIRQEYSSQAQ